MLITGFEEAPLELQAAPGEGGEVGGPEHAGCWLDFVGLWLNDGRVDVRGSGMMPVTSLPNRLELSCVHPPNGELIAV